MSARGSVEQEWDPSEQQDDESTVLEEEIFGSDPEQLDETLVSHPYKEKVDEHGNSLVNKCLIVRTYAKHFKNIKKVKKVAQILTRTPQSF